MTDYRARSPVAFFIFNRPDLTRQSFQQIASARPARLFVIADGPRPDHPDDARECAGAREVVDRVDWDCDVARDYSETNLGCGRRVAAGLDWVFSTVDRAVILEDDCLPHPTFFRFCDELLDKYENDPRVGLISGARPSRADPGETDSYRFSAYPALWGWASWAGVWKGHDQSMAWWPQVRNSPWLKNVVRDRVMTMYWKNILDRVYRGEIDTWDYQFVATCWRQEALAITPAVNLVSNMGFGPGGAHCVNPEDALAALPTRPMEFPLRPPSEPTRDPMSDAAAHKGILGVRLSGVLLETFLKTPLRPFLWRFPLLRDYLVSLKNIFGKK